jgi:hypothetical protein
VLAQVPDGEACVTAEICFGDSLPQSVCASPRFGLSPLAYVWFDRIIPALMAPVYRRGVRGAYGSHMAPPSRRTRLLLLCLLATVLVGIWGLIAGRRCRPGISVPTLHPGLILLSCFPHGFVSR